MITEKFPISDTSYLAVGCQCILSESCMHCASVSISYVDEIGDIDIRFGYENLQDFCYLIEESDRVKKLLDNKLLLSEIIHDIGREYNEYYEGNIDNKGFMSYYFWGNSHKKIHPFFNSWMYNDRDGNVIFEITPFYPWHHTKKKRDPKYVSYQEFIFNYKSTIKVKVPKYNLVKWIDIAKRLREKYLK